MMATSYVTVTRLKDPTDLVAPPRDPQCEAGGSRPGDLGRRDVPFQAACSPARGRGGTMATGQGAWWAT